MSVKMRQLVEREIAEAVIKALLEAGFLLGVNDGEETTIRWSRDAKAVLAKMFTTDEDRLLVYIDADQDDPLNVERETRPDYWVMFVYGNDGWDVISDYTVALEPYIGAGTTVEQVIKKYED